MKNMNISSKSQIKLTLDDMLKMVEQMPHTTCDMILLGDFKIVEPSTLRQAFLEFYENKGVITNLTTYMLMPYS